MKDFLCEDFLLSNETARRLYHEHAADQPIYDYHCHLNPAEVASNRKFDNLGQIWLEGDHYKWRGMRSAGIQEQLITGSASDYDKFQAWAKTVPMTLGNPLYHWTHLELRRPFGITGKRLSPETADTIWNHCNELLQTPEFSARGIMKQMNVVMAGTTDDPVDTLEHHKAIADDESFDIEVLPSWRPDKAFKIELDGFADYMTLLGRAADVEINSFATLLDALDRRLSHFDAHGCRAADHGIEIVRYAQVPSEQALDHLIKRRLSGEKLTEEECAQFSTAVQVWLGKRYAKLGWVMQLHIGAQRNNNTRMFQMLGADAGFDSISDRTFAFELAHLLDEMDQSNELPKTILYCLNPRDNEMMATMIGNFQGGGIAGKVQFGSGWWFNDQKDGMQRQMEQLSQLGLLSQFVGMLTDSRSFLSYTRHEYFRRILCDMIGRWAENGEVPNDLSLLGPMVEDICFNNAKRYFSIK
ncbi:Uronate isomerase [Vibrio mediterranei]|uniref:Uronate isomerase n=1 Tax=Vibrio mediterranei TaxID=689 RepID=A0A2S9ZM29_9VIBR|nr:MULTISPECIES: glucuronate isomerase [Vibrio]AYV23550.1 glucuronate isomerase [Vibrio mediterranei]KFA98464.1 glucuronate isomerase [Vibrio sp. ER1A]MDA0108647.1 glucuronate isomerase [Vibrio sp. La 4.2.2]NUW75686.1 glucuronate isomerase [Vibrio mediterranei]PCD87250.1 glucuronate isomerase [Vibrio mediterranei]